MPPSCQRRRCLTVSSESPPPVPSQHAATLPVPRGAQIPRNHVKRRPRRPSPAPHLPFPPFPSSGLLSFQIFSPSKYTRIFFSWLGLGLGLGLELGQGLGLGQGQGLGLGLGG